MIVGAATALDTWRVFCGLLPKTVCQWLLDGYRWYWMYSTRYLGRKFVHESCLLSTNVTFGKGVALCAVPFAVGFIL